MKNVSLYNKIFFIFILSSIISIGAIFWYGFQSTSKSYISSAYEMSYRYPATLEAAIEDQLSHVPKDVMFITDFYALQKFLIWRSLGEEGKAKKWKTIFLDATSDFLRTSQDYYQTRVIDLEGNEIINIKYIATTGKTIVTNDLNLQNKKNSDYFQEAKKLQEGEFSVSSMNLNVEHGKIEEPYIPVLRFATPIMGTNNEVVAIYVVNYYAKKLLDMIEKEYLENNEHAMEYYLIDTQGNYLYHTDKLKQWGKQLQNGFNFNKEHFSIEKYAKGKEHGSFSLNEKIYSFHEVHPLAKHSDRHWYIISSAQEDVALASLEEFTNIFIMITCLIIFLNFFLIRAFIKNFTTPLEIVSEQLLALSFGEIKKEKINYSANDEIANIVKSTQKVINSIEKVIQQADAVASGEVDIKLELLGRNDSLGIAINKMVQRLQEIESLAENLSVGNYDTNIVASSSKDKLGLALLGMISYLKSVTKIAENIAQGQINIDYKSLSSEDRLGIAMLKMVSYLKTILSHANAISREDFSKVLHVKSDNDQLGVALVTMTNILSNTYINNKDEMFFNEGIGEFGDKLAGLDDKDTICEVALGAICRYTQAVSGVVYLYNADTLEFNNSFAYEMTQKQKRSIKLGEGMIGQVGLDQKFMLLKDIANDTYEIQTATTSSQAKEVFLFPLVHESVLHGVVEILSTTKFTKIKIDYLLKIAGMFAISIHTTRQSLQIKVLLEKSQRAFEELQEQSEELQESNVQMEEYQQQLTQQTHELEEKNKMLEKSKEEINQRADDLEKASRYKSEFLANMSHELRTPLNSIILLSKLLSKNQNDTLGEKDIEKSLVINKAGNELLLLINDILDLSKIESGHMELHNTVVFSGDIIDDAKGMFCEIAQEKKLDFVLQDNLNASFISDKMKLEQVLKNLLSNALKFTKEGKVSFEIKKDKDDILFLISDTGIGIAPEKAELIFEPFKQVDGSISREFGGTGLGLSISKTIINLMNGEINVVSELKKGSSFIVRIPFLAYEEQNQDAEAPKELMCPSKRKAFILQEQEPENSDMLRNKNILVVDDDSKNIFTMTSTLENLGAEVFSAFNGLEAMELLREQKVTIDLILMDLMMPVMDGVTAIKTIRSDEAFKEIPIIVVSAKNMPKDKEECLDAGANDYLTKPLQNNTLVAMLKAWIG